MSTQPARRCIKCNRTMKGSCKSPIEAEIIHQGHGLCTSDYTAWKRAGRPELAYDETPEIEADDSALIGFLAARRRRGVPASGLAVA